MKPREWVYGETHPHLDRAYEIKVVGNSMGRPDLVKRLVGEHIVNLKNRYMTRSGRPGYLDC